MSPAMAGGFPTAAPPGKPNAAYLSIGCSYQSMENWFHPFVIIFLNVNSNKNEKVYFKNSHWCRLDLGGEIPC